MKKLKGKLKKVLLICLGIIVVLIVIIAIFANKNVKVMNKTIDDTISLISQKYNVTSVQNDEYETMKVYGVMKFNVKQYDVENIGNLSVMTVNMGVMQMATFVLNPQDKNLPMVSADYMYILGKRKCYYEFYDLVEVKDKEYDSLLTQLQQMNGAYSELKDIEMDEAWYDEFKTVGMYKSGKTSDDEALTEMLTDGMEIYINSADKLPELTDLQKKKKNDITKEYTEGLITKGGISTDAFKKSLGEDTTRDFFSKVFFGTEKIDELK